MPKKRKALQNNNRDKQSWKPSLQDQQSCEDGKSITKIAPNLSSLHEFWWPVVSLSNRLYFVPRAKYVLQNFLQVTHGDLTLNEALLRAWELQDLVSFQKLHYHVKIARRALLSHSHPGPLSREGMVIEVCASDRNTDTGTMLSPLTEASSLLAAALPPQ